MVTKRDATGNARVISIQWGIEDIIMTAKRQGIELSPAQAGQLLENIDEHHDCEIGVTWDTIQFAIDDRESIFKNA